MICPVSRCPFFGLDTRCAGKAWASAPSWKFSLPTRSWIVATRLATSPTRRPTVRRQAAGLALARSLQENSTAHEEPRLRYVFRGEVDKTNAEMNARSAEATASRCGSSRCAPGDSPSPVPSASPSTASLLTSGSAPTRSSRSRRRVVLSWPTDGRSLRVAIRERVAFPRSRRPPENRRHPDGRRHRGPRAHLEIQARNGPARSPRHPCGDEADYRAQVPAGQPAVTPSSKRCRETACPPKSTIVRCRTA